MPLASTTIDLNTAADPSPLPLPMTQDIDQRLIELVPPMYVNTKALADRRAVIML